MLALPLDFFLAKDGNIVLYGSIAFNLLALTYIIYTKLTYKEGESSYILFPTYNDQYTKFTGLILGAAILAGTITLAILFNVFNARVGFGLSTGLLIFAGSIPGLPSGRLKITDGKLKITGIRKALDLNELKEIRFENKKILFTSTANKFSRVDNLNLDIKSVALMMQYIKERTGNQALALVDQVVPGMEII